MRLFTTLLAVMLLWLLPTELQAQATASAVLARADTMVHNMQYTEVEAITDSLLATNSQQPDRAAALLLKARLLLHNHDLDSATTVVFKALDLAEALELRSVATGAHITLGLIYEWVEDYAKSSGHLDQAEQLIIDHQLDWHYAQYYVRRASLIATIRFHDQRVDSAEVVISLAHEAINYATKQQQLWHLADAHIVLGIVYSISDGTSTEELYHSKQAAIIHERAKNYNSAGMIYADLAHNYANLDSVQQAWQHFNKGVALFQRTGPITSTFYSTKAYLFRLSGQHDSAYWTLRKMNALAVQDVLDENEVEISELTAVHENEKKEAEIKVQLSENKKQQTLLNQTIVFLILVIGLAALLFFSYRRVRTQNKQITQQRAELKEGYERVSAQNEKINQQREELEKSLHQQQVLLAEVQHRVKNNLQVIIAMLDLQREAQDGKSIDEITTENQRRIESMAFLHDKVYLSEDLENVKLQSYLDEIAVLLRDTYSGKGTEVGVSVDSKIATLPVGKAIPLGLTMVELLMNSFKHAFEGRENGHIHIAVQPIEDARYTSSFVYHDNGRGFTGQPRSGGLGLEIIQGFVGQLHGKIVMDGSNGFTASVQF